MDKAAKPATSKKTPNRNQKSAAVDAKKPANESRTKENPPNPAAGAAGTTPAPSRRRPLGEVTAEANNVEDMAKKMLEMQGKHHPQQSVKGGSTHQRHATTSGT
jgi:hypothetical protein